MPALYKVTATFYTLANTPESAIADIASQKQLEEEDLEVEEVVNDWTFNHLTLLQRILESANVDTRTVDRVMRQVAKSLELPPDVRELLLYKIDMHLSSLEGEEI